MVPLDVLSGRGAQTPPSMNLPTNPTKDVEEMEEVGAGEVNDDSRLKHQKPQEQQAERVTAVVLDQKGERQHLKVPRRQCCLRRRRQRARSVRQ